MILVTTFIATLTALVKAALAAMGVTLAMAVFVLIVAFIGAAVVGLLGS